MAEEATPSSSGTDWKAEGNAEFRSKNYLKAAALYTRGLKADPTNAVLYRWGHPTSPAAVKGSIPCRCLHENLAGMLSSGTLYFRKLH